MLRRAALLAVRKDASEEDIKKAYRMLAQTCHPDKHQSAAMREVWACVLQVCPVCLGSTGEHGIETACTQVATANFNRIHEAYEILRYV